MRKDVYENDAFSIIPGLKSQSELQEKQIDPELLSKIKNFNEIDHLSAQERRLFYEDIFKIKFPYTKFSQRLNANYKEPMLVPLLTWQLYNWQYLTRQSSPSWITNERPVLTIGMIFICFVVKISMNHRNVSILGQPNVRQLYSKILKV